MSIVDPFLVSKLIELIRGNRCIYDPRHEQHNNRAVINSIWKSIAAEMGQPETLCREKWINLRSNFARELRKTRRKMFEEGGAINGGSQWVHFEAMTFLAPFVKTRLATMENMASEVEDINLIRVKVERDINNDTESAKSSNFRTDGAGVGLGDESDLSLSSIHENQPRKRKYYSLVEDETDDDKMFLLSLLPKLKQLPVLENLSFRVEVHTLLLSKLQAVLCQSSTTMTTADDHRIIRAMTSPTPSSSQCRNEDDDESSDSQN